MKKIVLIIILFAAMLPSLQAQEAVDWKVLSNVRWRRSFVEALGDYFDVALFGKNIEALNNKEITIKGFYVPVDMEGTMFALSKSPSNMCFFCGTGGIESVMEISVKKGHKEFKRIKTDKYIEVKGTLSLNRDDPEHLMYILEDAELVEIIK